MGRTSSSLLISTLICALAACAGDKPAADSGVADVGPADHRVADSVDARDAPADPPKPWVVTTTAGIRGYTVNSSGQLVIVGVVGAGARLGSMSLPGNPGDLFVARVTSDGQWAAPQVVAHASAAGKLSVEAVAAVANDEVVVSGKLEGTVRLGATTLMARDRPGYSSPTDVFVAKLSATGQWLWAVRGGSVRGDEAPALAVDAAGNAWVAGAVRGSANFGEHVSRDLGDRDLFVAKLSPKGSWQWVARAGGQYGDIAHAIAVDAHGQAHITGQFQGTATFGDRKVTAPGDEYSANVFVAKLSASGRWLWATHGGTAEAYSNDQGMAIAVDDAGSVFVTGYLRSQRSPGMARFGETMLRLYGAADAFFGRLTSAGRWLWVKRGGGPGFDEFVGGMAIDAQGRLVVCGNFSGKASFGTGATAASLASRAGSQDVFVVRMSRQHGEWLSLAAVGGDANDIVHGCTVDPGSDATYVFGSLGGPARFGSRRRPKTRRSSGACLPVLSRARAIWPSRRLPRRARPHRSRRSVRPATSGARRRPRLAWSAARRSRSRWRRARSCACPRALMPRR